MGHSPEAQVVLATPAWTEVPGNPQDTSRTHARLVNNPTQTETTRPDPAQRSLTAPYPTWTSMWPGTHRPC